MPVKGEAMVRPETQFERILELGVAEPSGPEGPHLQPPAGHPPEHAAALWVGHEGHTPMRPGVVGEGAQAGCAAGPEQAPNRIDRQQREVLFAERVDRASAQSHIAAPVSRSITAKRTSLPSAMRKIAIRLPSATCTKPRRSPYPMTSLTPSFLPLMRGGPGSKPIDRRPSIDRQGATSVAKPNPIVALAPPMLGSAATDDLTRRNAGAYDEAGIVARIDGAVHQHLAGRVQQTN